MKTLFFYFIILTIGFHTLELQGQENTSQKLYEQGVAAYENGDYQKALDLFVDAIEASEVSDSDEAITTYNYLGKSYFALQKEEQNPLNEYDSENNVEDVAVSEKSKQLNEETETAIAEENTLEDNEVETESTTNSSSIEDTEISGDSLASDIEETVLPNSEIIASTSAYQGGVAAYRQSDFVTAIQYFTIVIEAGEGNIEKAFNYRGMCYHALKDYEAAITDYDSTVELDKKSYITYHNRGIAKQSAKRYNEALMDYNKALQINPSYSRAYESRAVLYYKMRDMKKAIKDCEKILELDANNENARRLKEKLQEESE